MGSVRRLIEALLHRLPQGPEDQAVAPAPPPGAAAAAVAGIPPPGAAGTAADVVPYPRILPSPLVRQASQHPSRDVRTGRRLKHSADSNPSAAISMPFGAGRSMEAKNTATADATDSPLPGPGPKLVSTLQVLLPASAPHRGIPALQVQNSACAFCGGYRLFFLRHLGVTVSAASRALHASARSFQSTPRFHTYLALALRLSSPSRRLSLPVADGSNRRAETSQGMASCWLCLRCTRGAGSRGVLLETAEAVAAAMA
jgi:hypothetical protein